MENTQQKMNCYTYDELEPGVSASFQVMVTEEMQEAFTRYSGDVNPIHVDKEFSNNVGGYRDRLVYGMLTASFYSTLVGVYLPGRNCLFHRCDVQWPAPVYIGDELTVKGTVVSKDEHFRQLEIKAEIRNQEGRKVSRAKLFVGVTK